jgi:hypothetical protein
MIDWVSWIFAFIINVRMHLLLVESLLISGTLSSFRAVWIPDGQYLVVNRHNFERTISRVPVLVLRQHQVTFVVLHVCCCRYIVKESSLHSHFRYHVLVLLPGTNSFVQANATCSFFPAVVWRKVCQFVNLLLDVS